MFRAVIAANQREIVQTLLVEKVNFNISDYAGERKVGLAVIKMTDKSVLDAFLSSPWLVKVDMTQLSV